MDWHNYLYIPELSEDDDMAEADHGIMVNSPSLYSSQIEVFEEADSQRWGWHSHKVEKPKEVYGCEIPPPREEQ